MTAPFPRLDRREFVGAVGGASVAALAGCFGDEGSEEGGDDDESGSGEGTEADVDDAIEVGDLAIGPDEFEREDVLEFVAHDEFSVDGFVDETGRGQVVILTRDGADGTDEPTFLFDPPAVTVDVGTTVVWQNDHNDFHTVTSSSSATERDHDDRFNDGVQRTGDTVAITFTEPGLQPYYCEPHPPFMNGLLEVVD